MGVLATQGGGGVQSPTASPSLLSQMAFQMPNRRFHSPAQLPRDGISSSLLTLRGFAAPATSCTLTEPVASFVPMAGSAWGKQCGPWKRQEGQAGLGRSPGGDGSISVLCIVPNAHGEALPRSSSCIETMLKASSGAFCCARPRAGVVLC